MSGWWLSGLLVVGLTVTVVSKVDLDSPLRLAHCRASCLYTMKVTKTTNRECQTSSSCSQCWEACELLPQRPPLCAQVECGPGCLEVCRFHSLSPSEKPPVLLTQHEEVLILSDSRVSWPPADTETLPVYVVMGRQIGKSWSQVCQTLEITAGLPPGMDLETVRVLVVDWRGLRQVLSPRPPPSLAQVQSIIRSLGLQKTIRSQPPLPPLEKISDATNITVPTTQVPYITEDRPWRLREVSMIHQSVLVLAQVSWEPQQLAQDNQLMYLVTWEVDGGVLRGNLLTNHSHVTLSLWPDTVYRIQVEVLNPEYRDSRSETLILDTHHSQSESTSTTSSYLHTQRETESLSTTSSLLHSADSHVQTVAIKRHRQTLLVAGVAAVVAVLMVLTLTLTWRWRHCLSLPHTKLIDEESGMPRIFRVFPPAVRLVAESHLTPAVFTSTDNLLQVDSATN